MMMALLFKDLKDFWSNSFGALSIAALIVLAFLFLWIFPDSSYISFGLAEGELYFQFLSYLLLFVVPAFAVSLLSNEFKYGTEELLRSLSISWNRTIMAKFLAAFVILLSIVLLTGTHLYVVHQLTENNTGINLKQMFGSYLGILGVGACYISISLLVASFVRQNTASYILSVIACFLIFYGFNLVSSLDIFAHEIGYWLERLSLYFHVDQISRGILSLSTIIYLLSIVGWCLWTASAKLSSKEV